jgi:hypothetical protein
MEQKASGFQWVITRDDLRFFFDYSRDSGWAASREMLLQRIKQKIGIGKVLGFDPLLSSRNPQSS